MSRRLVFGAGIKDIRTHHGCPYYERWKGVLRRCYSKSGEIPASYDGCRIADEWLTFSNFKRWMESRPWKGNHLDKDILRPWEKLYCPETSVFVPQYINTLMSEKPRGAANLPVGVSRSKRGHPFVAMIRNLGTEKTCLGTFNTAEEAHRAWATAKAQVIESAVDLYRKTDRFDMRICDALLTRANHLRTR
ncbi:hypothetical protein ACPTFC_08560 [Pseudomonas aeruginosa]|uniref:hypothetical protein n=1 Tax=Pseudomonas aeruginosa TaxID=287 RepID=UPI003CC58AD9